MEKSVYWVILVVLLCVSTLPADTYYVDDSNGNDNWNGDSPVYVDGGTGPVKTIRKGIEHADNGDTVIVADGIYYGYENLQLVFYQDDVTLKSANGPNDCILNFYEDDHTWGFNDGVNTLISGFKIRGIKYSSIEIDEQNNTVIENCIFENNMLYGDDSLLTCSEQGSLKLNNCLFSDNTFSQGSIIKAYGSTSLEVRDCEITENTSTYDNSIISCMGDCNAIIIDTQIDNNWTYGERNVEGISCSDNTNVKIVACTISENFSGDYFAGIMCEGAANVIISGCNISHNYSQEYMYGVDSRYCKGDLEILDTVISNNSTNILKYGCGIDCSDNNSVEIANCLIAFNEGGIKSSSNVQASIINCTIVSNRGNFYRGYGIEGSGQVVNCILKGNGDDILDKDLTVSYSNISDDTDHIWPGVGNINADPLFADADGGDYHLLSQAGRWDSALEQWVRDDVSSPCIDAGDPADWIDDEPAGNGGRINMGYFGGTTQASKADYCTGLLYGDLNRDCLVNFIDFALMTSDWLNSTIEQP